MSQILASIGQASYTWDISANEIKWSENFAALIGFKPDADFQDARSFERMLTGDSGETRYSTVEKDADTGVDKAGRVFQCIYSINAEFLDGEDPIWIEDTGRWYPDERGKPARAEGVVRIINERRKREENLQRRSDYDDLTGLPNRRYLQDYISHIISSSVIGSNSTAFLILALKDFEKINNIYGFAAGDEILTTIGKTLQGLMRSGDILARFSGAKFGVILKDCQQSEFPIAAYRLIDSIDDKVIKTSCGPVALRANIGACLLPRHAQNPTQAIACALDALKDAKKQRRIGIQLYDYHPDLIEAKRNVSTMVTRFIEALEAGAMHLAFQPIIDAKSQSPVMYEALLRMDKVDEGMAENADFIKLASDLGLMRLVDLHALDLVLDALEEYPEAQISLNVTHETLIQGEWLTKLSNRLAQINNGNDRLMVELVAEQIPVESRDTIAAIRNLKELGCRVALDDFGSGSTAFTHLRDLGVCMVKIDGNLIAGLDQNPENCHFLENLCELAHAFNVQVAAEWVENITTAAKLDEWSFDFLQGKLYGMPLATAPWRKVNSDKTDEQKSSVI